MNSKSNIRFLEAQSLRSAFVWLLVDVFALGGLSTMMIYEWFRGRSFDWTAAMLLIVFGTSLVRICPLIYRRLDADTKPTGTK